MTVYSKRTKKGIRYYFQFQRAGEYHRGGGYSTKKEAQQSEAKERGSLSHLLKMAFGEVCDKYLTYIKDRNQSERWIYEKKLFIKKYLSSWYLLSIDEITSTMVENLIIYIGKTVSGYMGNKALKFLKAIMNYAITQAWLEDNPCNFIQSLPIEERAKYIPTLQDFLKVCQVANPKERALLILIFCTLGRVGEVLGIRKPDIFEHDLILRSRKHKDGSLKERKIPIGDFLKQIVKWLWNRSGDSEYLIANPRGKGNRYLRRPKLMKTLCKKAGVKFFGFHAIRHLATSILLARGTTLKTLQDLLGHAKIETTGIYIHSIGNSLSMAAQELGNVFNDHSTIFLDFFEKVGKNLNMGDFRTADDGEKPTDS